MKYLSKPNGTKPLTSCLVESGRHFPPLNCGHALGSHSHALLSCGHALGSHSHTNSISLQEPVDWQVSSLHRFSLLISTSEQNTGVKSHVFRFSTILTILHERTWGDKWKVRLSTCSVPFALVWKTCSGWFCVCFPPLFKISLKCV